MDSTHGRTNILGMASMILALVIAMPTLLGWIDPGLAPFILAAAAVVLGVVAIVMDRSDVGFSLVGIVFGMIGMLLLLFGISI